MTGELTVMGTPVTDSDAIPLRVTHAMPGRAFLVAAACGARDAAGAATSVYEWIASTIAARRGADLCGKPPRG